MSIKGYFLEALYPRFKVYRIIIINFCNEVTTYPTAINIGQNIEDYYPGFTDLGGILE